MPEIPTRYLAALIEFYQDCTFAAGPLPSSLGGKRHRVCERLGHTLEHDDGVRRAVCVWPAQDLLDFSLRHSEANPSERLAVNAVHRRQEPQRPAKEHCDGNEAGE